jgi:hypothetical protein
MVHPMKAIVAIIYAGTLIGLTACGEQRPPTSPSNGPSTEVTSDQALFTLVTQTQPFTTYARFPGIDVIRSGTSAHQPLVRVSMNATALSVLQDGRLPAGSAFPIGSVIFKEVLASEAGAASIYTIMLKDPTNPLSGNGWVWAEYRPDGGVAYSATNRGGACTSCHSLAQGSRNDYVRTFERQP